MKLFHRKKESSEIAYDPALMKPVIYSSICTGEKRAGFERRDNGKFEEVACLRSPKDLENFLRAYDLKEEDVETKY